MPQTDLKKKLRRAWAAYLQPCSNLQEKDNRLDAFLTRMMQLMDSFGEDIHVSSGVFDPPSVVSILARRFIVDVFNICTNVDGESDTSHLTKYLLQSRGWKILRVIYIIGPYKVSCRKELTELLLTICSILIGAENEECKVPQVSISCEPISCEHVLSYCPEDRLHEASKFHSDGMDSTSDEDTPESVAQHSTATCDTVEFVDLVCRIVGQVSMMEICNEGHPNPFLSDLILQASTEIIDCIIFHCVTKNHDSKLRYATSLLRLLFRSMASVLAVGNASKCCQAFTEIITQSSKICSCIENINAEQNTLPGSLTDESSQYPMANFVVGVMSGLVNLLLGHVEKYENVPREETTTFDTLVMTFSNSSFGDLVGSICDCVEPYFSTSSNICAALRTSLVQLGEVICVLKQKKTELRLHHLCSYQRIRTVNTVTHIWRNHHEILPKGTWPQSDGNLCNVRAISTFLLKPLWGNLSESTQLVVLASVMKSGLCCCMLETEFCPMILTKCTKLSKNAAFVAFTIVANLLQTASKSFTDVSETWCATCGDLHELLDAKLQDLSLQIRCIDSNHTSDIWDCINSHTSPLHFFDIYSKLLQERTDREFTVVLRKHLAQLVTVSLCDVMKKELFCRLLFPAILSKPAPITNEDVSVFLLELLPTFLTIRDNVELFKHVQGVQLVCENLVSIRKRNGVLKVLQVLVAQEMGNLTEVKSGLTLPVSDRNSALSVFHNVLVEHSSSFATKLRMLCHEEGFECEDVCYQSSDTVYLLDLWMTCMQLTARCNLYKMYLHDTQFVQVPQQLMENLLRFLNSASEGASFERAATELKFHTVFDLIGILLSMCLELTSFQENCDMCELREPIEMARPYLTSLVLNLVHSYSVFEMLIKVALVLDVNKQTDISKGLHVIDDAFDDDSLPSSTSIEENKHVHGNNRSNNGYEADTETLDDDDPNVLNVDDDNCDSSEQTSGFFQAQRIVHRDVVSFILELLPKFYRTAKETNKDLLHIVASVSHKLNLICENNIHNAAIFSNLGFVSYLLDEWNFLLSTCDMGLVSDIQANLLAIFATVSQHQFSKDELWKFLTLFRQPLAPLKILSATFKKIADQTLMHPSSALTITTHCNPDMEIHESETEPQQDNIASNLHVDDSFAAIGFPLANHNVGRSIWQEGISISCWLLFDNFYATNSLKKEGVHLISIRTEGISLETYVDNGLDQLNISVFSCNGTKTMHGNAVLPCQLKSRSWRHFTISVCGNVTGDKVVLQVAVYMDASEIGPRMISHFAPCSLRNSSEAIVLIGKNSIVKDKMDYNGLWQLGNLHVIHGSLLSIDEVGLLFSLGPERGYLLEYGSNLQDFYLHSSVVTKLLSISVDPIHLLKCGHDMLRNLQGRLMLVYSPQMRDCFMTRKRSAAVAPTSGLDRHVESLCYHAVTQKCAKFVNLEVVANSSLITSVANVGVESVVFLLGNIVELSSDDVVHTKMLAAIVRLLSNSIQLYIHFDRIEIWELIFRILATNRYKVTVYTLKALLDGCLSVNVLIRDAITGNWNIGPQTSAVITNAQLLSVMIRSWKVWEKGGEDLLAMLFETLSSLVHKSHPRNSFNLRQLDSIHTLDLLLTLCKEKVVHEGGCFHFEKLCQSLVSLMRLLIGWPTDAHMLLKLFQCILLLHPSKCTYVCHASSSFYFRLRTHYRMLARKVGDSARLNTKHGLVWEHGDLEYDVINTGADPPVNEALQEKMKLTEVQNVNQLQPKLQQDLLQSHSVSPEPILTTQPANDSDIKISSLKEDCSPSEIPGNTYWSIKDLKGDCSRDMSESPDMVNNANDGVESRICLLETALLDLCCEAILGIAQSQDASSLQLVCNPAALIVFMHRPEITARLAALRVIDAWLSQASDEQIASWLNLKGFHLIANQLYQYEATSDIIELCFSILLGQPFTFEQRDILISPSVNLPAFRLASTPLILSCLCQCCNDVELCQSVLNTLLQIAQFLPVLLVQLVANGIIEVLCKVLVAASHLNCSETDEYGFSDKDHLMRSIDTMFCHIATSFVNLHGTQELQVVTDVLLLLSYCTRMESKYGGTDGNSVLALRNCHCNCLCAIIGHLQESISTYEKGAWVNFLEQMNQIPSSQLATTSDLQERLRLFMVKAVDFLVFADIVKEEVFVSEEEKSFSRYLTCLLLQGVKSIIKKRKTGLRMSPALRECFKLQFGRLIVFLISPIQSLEQRLFVVNLLLADGDRKCSEVAFAAFGKIRELEQKFTVFLHHLASGNSEGITKEQKILCCKLRDVLEQNNVIASPLPCPSTAQVGDWTLIFEEKESCLEDTYRNRLLWQRSLEPAEQRVLQSVKGLCLGISEAATDVTRTVSDERSGELKTFLIHIKSQFSRDLRTRQAWQKIIAQMTHERALWHNPNTYPTSWQLDSTEGPMRVRKRMTRSEITLAPRFLLENSRCKRDSACSAKTLESLFENDSQSTDSATIIDQLQDKEKIRCMLTCVIVTPANEINGEVLVGVNRVFFVGEQLNQSRSDVLICHSWSCEDIKEMMKRRFQLCDNALELFFTDGQTYLIAFHNKQDRDELYSQIMMSNLPCLAESDNLDSMTKLWRDQLITNFEYLTHINKIAGRSFNDLMQYPVMPFVLANYTSPKLDMNDPKSFRTLSKPMAVQNNCKEQHFMNQYNYLRQEQSRCSDENDALMASIGPYHYGSHYSNSGIVLHFLVRLPPYTQMFLSYQDHNFDIPDRTFHSLHTSWRLSSSESTTDVKELIPEFFFLPEFLLNSEGFNFGVRQTGERVHDVVLPDWCRNDARLFTLIHRQALESAFVTENIHSWIDLVFGYKQTGKAAVEAINVFHPATYYGFKVEEIQDHLRKNAMQTMIRTFGQTPCQVFRAPHPMIKLTLTSPQQDDGKMKVLEEVDGLQWGNYVGSPSLADPVVVWKKRQSSPVCAFLPLLTNDVFGLTENTCLLLKYCKEKGASMINTTYVMSAALVTWGHPDGILRLKLKRDNIPQPFIQTELWDDVTVCTTVPDCRFLFVGFASGIISVYPVTFNQVELRVCCDGLPIHLYGHRSSITCIIVCRNYSIVVTASLDRTCIIWDLIKHEYVRSIEGYPAAVDLAAVCDISGEIATVSSTDNASFLFLHTINAQFVGKVESEQPITSICFSKAPEGISVNVVCAGLADGSIKMWNTWNLGLVRVVTIDKFTLPIICMTYSHDSQHLYAANKNGVVVWESQSRGNGKTPKFLTLV